MDEIAITQAVLEYLDKAENEFCRLPLSPGEREDFMRALFVAQTIVLARHRPLMCIVEKGDNNG